MSDRMHQTQTEMAAMVVDGLEELGADHVDVVMLLDAMATSGVVFRPADFASEAFMEVLTSTGDD